MANLPDVQIGDITPNPTLPDTAKIPWSEGAITYAALYAQIKAALLADIRASGLTLEGALLLKNKESAALEEIAITTNAQGVSIPFVPEE